MYFPKQDEIVKYTFRFKTKEFSVVFANLPLEENISFGDTETFGTLKAREIIEKAHLAESVVTGEILYNSLDNVSS